MILFPIAKALRSAKIDRAYFA